MSGWHVITAGPSAGKSSIIRELNARGYRTAPEAARIVFNQAISEGKDIEEMVEAGEHHEKIEQVDRRIMSNMPEDETVFFDRSIADNIAYRRMSGYTEPNAIISDGARFVDVFDLVFLLERVPFQKDGVRVEDDEEEAQESHEAIINVYEDLGVDLIEVPLIPVDERADYIEERL